MAAGAGAEAGAGGKQVRGETTSGRRRAMIMMRRQASLTGDGERRTTRAQDSLTLAGRVQSSRLVLVGGGGALSVRVRPRLKNETPSRILTRGPEPLTRDPHFLTKDISVVQTQMHVSRWVRRRLHEGSGGQMASCVKPTITLKRCLITSGLPIGCTFVLQGASVLSASFLACVINISNL